MKARLRELALADSLESGSHNPSFAHCSFPMRIIRHSYCSNYPKGGGAQLAMWRHLVREVFLVRQKGDAKKDGH